MEAIQAMKPSQLEAALKVIIKEGSLCVNISGPPGVGKSSIVKAVTQDLGMDMIDIRAVLLDPVDLRGVPSVKDGMTHWNPPKFLPQAGCKPTVVFLDELDKAPGMTQSALLQFTLDRRIGEYVCPDNVVVISAMNRAVDRAGSQKMNTALANRFVHLKLDADKEEWKRWAVVNDVHQYVRAYLDWRPSHLMDFDPSRPEAAFASPRSWEFASRLLKAFQAEGIRGETLSASLRGALGPGVGSEFNTFMSVYDKLPDVKEMLAKPTKAKVPDDSSIRYAVVTAAVDFYRGDKGLAKNLIQLLAKFPPEYAIIGVQDACSIDMSFGAQPETIEWLKKTSQKIA